MDIHSEVFKIQTFQVDSYGKAKISAVCNWLQEVASSHAMELGFSQSHLHKKGLMWALYRFRVMLTRTPDEGEELEWTTWVSKMKGPFSEREYKVVDNRGNEIIKATSLWFSLNKATRKPQEIGSIGKRLELKFGPKSIEGPEKIQIPKEMDVIGKTTVNYFHMDTNHHVHNVSYIELILGALQKDTWETKEVMQLDINYLKEINEFHHELTISRANGGLNKDVFIITDNSSTLLASLMIHWRIIERE